MRTYVISLPARKDRLEQMKLQAALTMPGEHSVFEATDGSKFTEYGSKRMRGHIGCWDSHRRLMEKLAEEKNGMTLVLEDDCEFLEEKVKDIATYMQELPEDWDLLYLGGVNQDAPESFSEHLDHAKNILQTHAYIIRDKFIPVLLETLNSYQWKVDIVFSQALKKGKCFICSPIIAGQNDSRSDISRC